MRLRWTVEEVSLLRELYPRQGPSKELAARLGRTRLAVHYKALSLHLVPPRVPKARWTPSELRTLRDCWADYSARSLQKRLPGRSWESIRRKAQVLKLGERLQGYLTIPRAAEQVGVDEPLLWKIIRQEGVQYISRTPHKRRPIPCVDEEDITAAAKRYFDKEAMAREGKENVREAAKRLKVGRETLWKAHARARNWAPAPNIILELPARWDEVLRDHRAAMRRKRQKSWMANLALAHAANQRRDTPGSKDTAPSATPTASSSKNRSKVASSGSSISSPKTPDTTSTAASKRTASAPT